MVVDVFVQNPQRVTSTNMRKNMYVVTPRCAAAAAVVSAVVFRRPTKEYTHPYSMMHRRLPTAGIEVAPHYHQLLVYIIVPPPRELVYISQHLVPRFLHLLLFTLYEQLVPRYQVYINYTTSSWCQEYVYV